MGTTFPSATLKRRTVLGGVLALATAAVADAGCPRPAVLFVCPAGTVKSAIARETFKAQAAKAGLAVDVRSRGVEVQDHMSPQLVAELNADHINPAAERAQKLGASDLWPGQIVVAFDDAGQDPRLAGARTWDVPSFNENYPAAKAALAVRVADLVSELKARQSRACV